MVASERFFGYIKMSFKVICGIVHEKTCQLVREIVLCILNTPGKLLEISQKKSK